MDSEILYFKEKTIKYCFDKMTEIYDNKISPKIRPSIITGKNIGEGAWQIACYGDFFFLEVTSFFDSLARYFTKNENPSQNIYFQNWIEYVIKRNSNDKFILHLNIQFKNWFEDFKKIRNKLSHLSHLYAEIKDDIKIENKKVRFLTMDIDGKEIELMEYCNYIQKEIDNLTDFIYKNNYWNKQFKYPPGT